MIQEITLNNFKIFEHVSIELGAITVLIGPQGTGKSTILDALGLLSQSGGRESLNLDGPWISGVSFLDLAHKHDERKVIEFGLKLKFEGAIPPIDQGPYHTVNYLIRFESSGFKEQRATFKFQERELEFRTTKFGKWNVPQPLSFEGRPTITFSGSTFTLLPFRFYIDGRDYPLHQNLNLLRQEILNDVVGGWHFVRSQRGLRQNRYDDQGGAKFGPWLTQDDAVNTLAYRWDFRDKVSEWLNRVVGRKVNFQKVAGQITVEIGNGLVHPISNEGEGVRQLIWLLGALAAAEPGSLVGVEEPEVHLHPEAQSRLVELLKDLVLKEDKRILFTTHSEHMLFGFLTAVAKQELPADELAVYYLTVKDGSAKAEKLTVDERGMIEGGLKGFFEAGLEELDSYLEALSTASSRLRNEV